MRGKAGDRSDAERLALKAASLGDTWPLREVASYWRYGSYGYDHGRFKIMM